MEEKASFLISDIQDGEQCTEYSMCEDSGESFITRSFHCDSFCCGTQCLRYCCDERVVTNKDMIIAAITLGVFLAFLIISTWVIYWYWTHRPTGIPAIRLQSSISKYPENTLHAVNSSESHSTSTESIEMHTVEAHKAGPESTKLYLPFDKYGYLSETTIDDFGHDRSCLTNDV